MAAEPNPYRTQNKQPTLCSGQPALRATRSADRVCVYVCVVGVGGGLTLLAAALNVSVFEVQARAADCQRSAVTHSVATGQHAGTRRKRLTEAEKHGCGRWMFFLLSSVYCCSGE